MTTETLSTLTVDPCPLDTVSRVAFSPEANLLLVSSWSGTLNLYDTSTGSLRVESNKYRAAFLDAAWASKSVIAAVALDGAVLRASVTESGLTEWKPVGNHSEPARCVVAMSEDLLVSTGWDKRLRLWNASSELVGDIDAGGKVYGATRCGEHGVLFINSERQVRLLDVRKPSNFVHDKVPPKLSYQLRGISANRDGTQYVVGSTAGRVAVEWLDNQRDSFSFKCHRFDGLAFPVNCVSHNSKYSSFATGGGDGHVSFWDGEARKRIAQYTRYPTSIASIDFDTNSTRIAIAVSYTFEEGEKDHPPDEVVIRNVDDSHIATKSSTDQALQENGK